MSSVVAPSAFKVSNITFSPVKTLDSGGKQAYLNYNGQPLLMQVGPLETPFGLSVFDKTPGAAPKYSVDLKLRGHDDPTNHPKTAVIYNAFNALDEFMLDQGVKNSASWFKGVKSREVLSELYTRNVRFSVDAEGNRKPYPPTLKVQLRKRDDSKREDKFEAEVYDDKKRLMNDVPLEDILVKGAVLTTLIQCTGVWFAGGKYGLSWKAVQVRADKVPHRLHGFAFVDEEGDAEAVAAAVPPAAKASSSAPVGTQNRFAALHDDDDEEVNDEEALAPAPPAKPAAAAAAAAVEDEDDEEAPVPVPAKKTTLTAKTVAKKIVKKPAA
jgi:hypothetical protein